MDGKKRFKRFIRDAEAFGVWSMNVAVGAPVKDGITLGEMFDVIYDADVRFTMTLQQRPDFVEAGEKDE